MSRTGISWAPKSRIPIRSPRIPSVPTFSNPLPLNFRGENLAPWGIQVVETTQPPQVVLLASPVPTDYPVSTEVVHKTSNFEGLHEEIPTRNLISAHE